MGSSLCRENLGDILLKPQMHLSFPYHLHVCELTTHARDASGNKDVGCHSKMGNDRSERRSAVSDSVPPWTIQARVLEWVAFPSSRDLPNPGIEPKSPALQVDSLPAEPPGK